MCDQVASVGSVSMDQSETESTAIANQTKKSKDNRKFFTHPLPTDTLFRNVRHPPESQKLLDPPCCLTFLNPIDMLSAENQCVNMID